MYFVKTQVLPIRTSPYLGLKNIARKLSVSSSVAKQALGKNEGMSLRCILHHPPSGALRYLEGRQHDLVVGSHDPEARDGVAEVLPKLDPDDPFSTPERRDTPTKNDCAGTIYLSKTKVSTFALGPHPYEASTKQRSERLGGKQKVSIVKGSGSSVQSQEKREVGERNSRSLFGE